jgi:hypothetical protein
MYRIKGTNRENGTQYIDSVEATQTSISFVCAAQSPIMVPVGRITVQTGTTNLYAGH